MTQEDKELLLKDICARLPYGVKVKQGEYVGELRSFNKYTISFNSSYAIPKPYLRPMSSMTEEEEDVFVSFTDTMLRYGKDNNLCCLPLDAIDWLNVNHFDYRRIYDEDKNKWMSMIERGLALEAPEGMYNY